MADGDIYVARMPPSENMLAEILCYHAQQAVEKAIKAVLTYYDLPVLRIHSIEKLLNETAKGIDVPDYVRAAAWLSDYASTTRYPGEWEPITNDENSRVLETAEKVLSLAKSICLEKE
jgi:HEPN domain-containing protein